MKLQDYISEAISSRKNSDSYTGQFPTKRTDGEAIIKWLDENDFTRLQKFGNEPLISYYEKTGERCYQTGDFGRDLGTHWIRIYDGEYVVFIRTCKESYLSHNRHLRICTMSKPEGTYIDKSFLSIKEYFDKK